MGPGAETETGLPKGCEKRPGPPKEAATFRRSAHGLPDMIRAAFEHVACVW